MAPGPSEAWGSAFFDFPPADGHVAPGLTAPDTWRVLFITKHADADVLKGVFASCRQGRDWVLESAPRARLRLNDARMRLEPLQQTSAALVRRGTLPVILDVSCSEAGRLALLAGVLMGRGEGVQGISISYTGATNLAAAVQALAGTCPHVARLELTGCENAVPEPGALPRLRHLSLRKGPKHHYPSAAMTEQSFENIRAYTQQLTSLAWFNKPNNSDNSWYDILSPDCSERTSTLTQLSTDASLDEDLIDLLLTSAPALKYLSVGNISNQAEFYEDQRWGLERLEGAFDDLVTLLYLPDTTAGSITVKHTSKDSVLVDTDTLSELGEREPTWHIEIANITLEQRYTIEAAEEPAALRDALATCGRLLAPGATIRLADNWQWSAQLLAEFTAAAPQQPHELQLPSTFDMVLTDELLSALMQYGGLHSKQLTVQGLELYSDQHADKPCPWERIVIEGETDAEMLACLPSGGRPGPDVFCETVAISRPMDQVALSRLERLTFRPLSELHFRVRWPEFMTILGSMEFIKTRTDLESPQAIVELVGWSMTHEAMEALWDVPWWVGELSFAECEEWPMQASEYAALAKYVSSDVDVWRFGKVAPAVMKHVIAGINRRTNGRRFSRVRVHMSAPESGPFTVHIGEHVKLIAE